MNVISLVPIYLRWHYTTAILDLFRIYGNIYWFLWHFFSVPETIKTFFSPWQRMKEKYSGGFNLGEFFSILLTNVLMRIVGVFMRTILLFFAFVASLATTSVLTVGFLIWFVIPFILLCLAFFGISAFFN